MMTILQMPIIDYGNEVVSMARLTYSILANAVRSIFFYVGIALLLFTCFVGHYLKIYALLKNLLSICCKNL